MIRPNGSDVEVLAYTIPHYSAILQKMPWAPTAILEGGGNIGIATLCDGTPVPRCNHRRPGAPPRELLYGQGQHSVPQERACPLRGSLEERDQHCADKGRGWAGVGVAAQRKPVMQPQDNHQSENCRWLDDGVRPQCIRLCQAGYRKGQSMRCLGTRQTSCGWRVSS